MGKTTWNKPPSEKIAKGEARQKREKEEIEEDCEIEPKEKLPATRKKRIELVWDHVGQRAYGYQLNSVLYVVTKIAPSQFDLIYCPTIKDKHDNYTFIGSFLSLEDGKKAAQLHYSKT